MSAGRIVTLSMQSLNKLYFQFFEKYVISHLLSPVFQISQLLRQKTAYDVHRFLQETLSSPNNDNYSVNTNPSINTANNNLTSNANTQNNPSFNYALPTTGQHPKSTYSESGGHNFNVTPQKYEDPKSFKTKIAMKRALTGLNSEDRNFEFKHMHDDSLMPIPSLSTANEPLPPVSAFGITTANDFKLELGSCKQPGITPIVHGKYEYSKQQCESKQKIMKDIVRKINKVFNDSHSKIEKYGKGIESQNKLFSLNVSTKLEKKEQGSGTRIKDYQFHMKHDLQNRKF